MKKIFLSKKIVFAMITYAFLVGILPLVGMRRNTIFINLTKNNNNKNALCIMNCLNSNNGNGSNSVFKNILNIAPGSGCSKIVFNNNNTIIMSNNLQTTSSCDDQLNDQMDTSEDDCFIVSSNSGYFTPTKKTVSKQLSFTSPGNQVIPINKSYKGVLKDLTDGEINNLVEKVDLFLSQIPYDSMTSDPQKFLGAIFFSVFSLLGKDAKPLCLKGDGDKVPCMIIQGYTVENDKKIFFVFSYGETKEAFEKIKNNKNIKIKNNAVSEDNKAFYIRFRPGVHFDKFLSVLSDKSKIYDCFFSNQPLPAVALYDHKDPYHAFLTEIEKKESDFKPTVCATILYDIYSDLINNGFSMEYENFFQLILVTMLSFVYNDIRWEEKCLDGRSDGILLPTDNRHETIILEFKFRGWKQKDDLTNVLEEALNQIENKYAQSCWVYGKPVYMIAIAVIWNETTKNFQVSVSDKKEYKFHKKINNVEEFSFM